ncbi:MAG: serine/threonine protein kinase [Verrucomicrobiota bacterium]
MPFSSDMIKETIIEREAELREPGTQLFSQARYQIRRVLGEGGMGITCLADEFSHRDLKRPVVLKFVKDSLDPQRMAQFINEVELSILFNHPNLVPIYRLESEVVTVEISEKNRKRTRTHPVYYAVMQYIDGWNVRQVMDRLRTLGMALNHDMAMFIVARVARGLHYVHEFRDANNEHLGLVHRDVSPENLLLDRFGRIKLADFGIARPMKLAHADAWLMAGKLLYCSPEQIDGTGIDARSDIYNLGLVMYYMFTNQERFTMERTSDRARERVRAKMKKPALVDLRHVHPHLAHMCEACLKEDPDERYQSCEDLATDVDIYFKESGKVLTNEQLEETLLDLFSSKPRFVSRRYIPLTGTPRLEHPDFQEKNQGKAEEPGPVQPTVRLDETDIEP